MLNKLMSKIGWYMEEPTRKEVWNGKIEKYNITNEEIKNRKVVSLNEKRTLKR